MKKRPLSIVLIALFYLVEPVGNIGYAALANQMPVLGADGVLAHLLWSDWLILGLFWVVAAGIYMVRPWGWYLFVAFSLLLVAYNLFVYFHLNPNYPLAAVLAFIAVITTVTAVFFRRHVYSPYFNPRLRWWEIASRYRVDLETLVFLDDQDPIATRTLDISTSGCFIDHPGPLRPGKDLRLRIRCARKEITCAGQVVRQAAESRRVLGYGIMFHAMPHPDRRRLQGLIQTLEQLGGRDRRGKIAAGCIPPDFDQRPLPLLRRIGLRFGAAA